MVCGMIEAAVIANNKEYARSLANNLEIYFGNNIKFNCYGNVDFDSIDVFNEDVLILSAFTVFQTVKYKAKESAKINIITLTLDKEYVKNLYKIPQESRAYLVNIDYRNCMEVITMLYDIGFDRLDLVPFYPGCEYDDTIKIAITPAELSLVPREITTIIDIGHRKIDLNSVYRIAKTIGVEISTSSEKIATALERQVNYYPEMELILGIADEMISETTVPCTGCHYCVSKCPKDLDIPFLLKQYNEAMVSGSGDFIASMALSSVDADKQPECCIGCHSCEKVCPQTIKISEELIRFARKLGR